MLGNALIFLIARSAFGLFDARAAAALLPAVGARARTATRCPNFVNAADRFRGAPGAARHSRPVGAGPRRRCCWRGSSQLAEVLLVLQIRGSRFEVAGGFGAGRHSRCCGGRCMRASCWLYIVMVAMMRAGRAVLGQPRQPGGAAARTAMTRPFLRPFQQAHSRDRQRRPVAAGRCWSAASCC